MPKVDVFKLNEKLSVGSNMCGRGIDRSVALKYVPSNLRVIMQILGAISFFRSKEQHTIKKMAS